MLLRALRQRRPALRLIAMLNDDPHRHSQPYLNGGGAGAQHPRYAARMVEATSLRLPGYFPPIQPAWSQTMAETSLYFFRVPQGIRRAQGFCASIGE